MSQANKSQSALEYMMTYGWAILIIVIVAAVLYSFGIFSPSSSISATVTGFSNLGSVAAQCTANGVLRINLGDSTGYPINVTDITAKDSSTGQISTFKPNSTVDSNPIIDVGGSYIFSVPNVCPPAGTHYSISTTVNYTEPGQPLPGPYQSTGTISGITTSLVLPPFVASFSGTHGYPFSSSSYISAPTSLGGVNFDWTATAWVYISKNTSSNPPSWTLPFFAFSPGSIRYEAFAFYSDTGQWTSLSVPIGMTVHICYADLNTGPIDSVTYGGLLSKWHFVAFSLVFSNPTAGDYTAYFRLDNNNVSFSSSVNMSGASPVLIGAQDYCDGNNFNGYIANLQLYSTDLSPLQIQSIKSSGIYGLPLTSNLVSWWPLNGTVGKWVKDYSGNNFNGTISGPVYFTSNYPSTGLP